MMAKKYITIFGVYITMSDRKHFVRKWNTKLYLVIFVGLASLSAIIYFINLKYTVNAIAPVERPISIDFQGLIKESKNLIRLNEARKNFSVTGNGLTVAVIDTGLRVTHRDFSGRVITQRNFISNNGSNINDASDGYGHGTHVTGIIAANGVKKDYNGIAPDVKIIPIKVLDNNSRGNFENIEKALEWIIKNHKKYNITAVCMSLGDSGNYSEDKSVGISNKNIIQSQIKNLKNNKIAVIAAAGNNFYRKDSKQGMIFPAIIPETISVGAVYDAKEGAQSYRFGAYTKRSAPDEITPFSQRLHKSVNPNTQTDIFAPGAPIISSGIDNDFDVSKQSGTSQAAPVVTGVVLLLQEYHLRKTGNLPSIDDLTRYLRDGGVTIQDIDNDYDNVKSTGLDFIRIDALGALETMDKDLR